MVAQLHEHTKNHRNVQLKWVTFTVYKLHLDKVVKKRKGKKKKKKTIKVSKRHQTGRGVGYVLTVRGDGIPCWGRKEIPPPHFLGLPAVCQEPASWREFLHPPAGLRFSSGRVSGLWGIFVVER